MTSGGWLIGLRSAQDAHKYKFSLAEEYHNPTPNNKLSIAVSAVKFRRIFLLLLLARLALCINIMFLYN